MMQQPPGSILQPPCCVRKSLLALTHCLLLLQFFCTLSLSDPLNIAGKGCDIDVLPTQVWAFCSPLLSVPGQSCFSVLISICWKRKLLWWKLRDELIYRYTNKLLLVSLTLWPFSRIIGSFIGFFDLSTHRFLALVPCMGFILKSGP